MGCDKEHNAVADCKPLTCNELGAPGENSSSPNGRDPTGWIQSLSARYVPNHTDNIF